MATYQSKLKRGQTAWFLRENKVVSLPVGQVVIRSVANDDGEPVFESITYCFRIYNSDKTFKDWEDRPELDCFASKEDLLASL